MDRFAAMATYVKVVELGSLSAAARSLDLGLTSVARQVSMLEARLGVRLLVRTTRRLVLTEEGKTYYYRLLPHEYDCGGTWFAPAYGANGVYYRVVPRP